MWLYNVDYVLNLDMNASIVPCFSILFFPSILSDISRHFANCLGRELPRTTSFLCKLQVLNWTLFFVLFCSSGTAGLVHSPTAMPDKICCFTTDISVYYQRKWLCILICWLMEDNKAIKCRNLWFNSCWSPEHSFITMTKERSSNQFKNTTNIPSNENSGTHR